MKTADGADGRHGRAPDDLFGIEPNIAGDAPGRHRAARAPRRAGTHSTKTRAEVARWRREAVAPEGHRPRPPGLDPRAAVAGRRHRPRAQAPRLLAAHAQEDGAPRAPLARCPTAPPRARSWSSTTGASTSRRPRTAIGARGPRPAHDGRAPARAARPGPHEDAVWKSFRNLGVRVQIVLPEELNAYDVLVNDWIVFSQADARRDVACSSDRAERSSSRRGRRAATPTRPTRGGDADERIPAT